MVGIASTKIALAVAAVAVVVTAIDPSPEVRQKWDDKCKASESLFFKFFDSEDFADMRLESGQMYCK